MECRLYCPACGTVLWKGQEGTHAVTYFCPSTGCRHSASVLTATGDPAPLLDAVDAFIKHLNQREKEKT